jgi:hypothetical protein
MVMLMDLGPTVKQSESVSKLPRWMSEYRTTFPSIAAVHLVAPAAGSAFAAAAAQPPPTGLLSKLRKWLPFPNPSTDRKVILGSLRENVTLSHGEV